MRGTATSKPAALYESTAGMKIPVWIRRAARKELAGVSPRRAEIAQRRLAYLYRFWRAEERVRGLRHTAARQRLIATIKAEDPSLAISLSTVYRWENIWRAEGLRGLAGEYGSHIGRRSWGFVRLEETSSKLLRSQLAGFAQLGLAFHRRGEGEARGAWFVWRPLRVALRSWLKATASRRRVRVKSPRSHACRGRVAG